MPTFNPLIPRSIQNVYNFILILTAFTATLKLLMLTTNTIRKNQTSRGRLSLPKSNSPHVQCRTLAKLLDVSSLLSFYKVVCRQKTHKMKNNVCRALQNKNFRDKILGYYDFGENE